MTIESNAVELKDATVEGRCVLVVRAHSERGSEVLEAAIVLPHAHRPRILSYPSLPDSI